MSDVGRRRLDELEDGERHGGDHCVVGPSCALVSGTVKRRGDAPERSGRRIKGKWVEVGLCLLETKLVRRPFAGIRRHEGTDGELREGDRRDEWLGRE
jgi:hypothetical protein